MTKHLRDDMTERGWRLSGIAGLQDLREGSKAVPTPQADPDPAARLSRSAPSDQHAEFDLMDNVPV
ncbi:hypothetical protein [uncultured Paracoccus sp.]|uniref:hypothetical protein n=1 Tax=uncultured Paracoccus sp. TaxID=189685 RepID=UPI002604AE1E|nr:hypothetical protein [uncultured Paracoccus sp.]